MPEPLNMDREAHARRARSGATTPIIYGALLPIRCIGEQRFIIVHTLWESGR
jgi:hypothetical protein